MCVIAFVYVWYSKESSHNSGGKKNICRWKKKKEVGRKAQINKCVFGVTQTKDSQEIAMSLLSVCVCPYQVGNTSFPPPPHLTSAFA